MLQLSDKMSAHIKLEPRGESQICKVLNFDQIQLTENIQSLDIKQNELGKISSTSRNIQEVKKKQEVVMWKESRETIENEQAMNVYDVTRNAKGDIECPICQASYKIIINLTRHIELHTKKFIFKIVP